MNKLKELDFELEHVQIITEENVDVKKLPKEIKDKMRVLNMICGTYLKHQKPETKDKIIALDIEITDLLADFVEDGLEEAEEETPPVAKVEETPPAPVTPIVQVTPAQTPKPVVETPPAHTPQVEEMMVKIKENINGGRIKISKFTEIIGRTPSSPIQIVGDLKLKKVFLSDTYQLM